MSRGTRFIASRTDYGSQWLLSRPYPNDFEGEHAMDTGDGARGARVASHTYGATDTVVWFVSPTWRPNHP